MNISIVIVSWNVKNHLRDCLRSIFETAADLSLEVFVVDNASSDGTIEMVKQEFPNIHLMANQENLGFAKANNQAIKLSNGLYVLLLNPDMRLLPGSLSGMIKFMDEHPEAGVAGCHLISPCHFEHSEKSRGINERDSSLPCFGRVAQNDIEYETVPQVRRFPTIWDQIAIILKLPHLFPWILNKYLMKGFDYEGQTANCPPLPEGGTRGGREVDSIRGSFFMILREIIEKLGGLDERYFIWFEEVDYCRQVQQAGWKIMYNPAVKCVDYVGQSFKQVMNYKKQKMFTESMLKYFKKWEPRWRYWLLWLLRPVGLGLALICRNK